ncbi:hypothetical protein CCZ01_00815 [Helicobacter monodelphidis]|uniref:NAD(P)H-dependent oxidoreductase n=1 Tax=Helicobacter sp. 15-1451 TaxID=2004995 RepID=UPI000DCF448E|nr:NAD(P)H-dependent oxidoreductase [Helicobacter sp. 15-1451]RAX59310.1 hypothetical protein CCZ01_00815 [Helicobacter sp. 15-1451]
MNLFLQAMCFRHACKLFDESKKISDEDVRIILESGQKSPSSFGLEPWHFLVIQSDDLKAKIRPVCWGQPQITSCSHLMILLSRKSFAFKKGSPYLEESFLRKAQNDVAKAQAIKDRFNQFITSFGERVDDWARMQTYLASANMMTSAAYIGIDSCPIEGFEVDKLDKILHDEVEFYRDGAFNIAYLIAFGYRIQPQSEQLRKSIQEIATFI